MTTDARRGDTVRWKKALAGVLLGLQEQAFEYLKALEVGGAELAPIAAFVERRRLCVKLPSDYDSALLRAVLDRPIRVCGMVRNEGEPGGGPFWVANPLPGTMEVKVASPSRARSLQPTSRSCRRPRISIRSIWCAASATRRAASSTCADIPIPRRASSRRNPRADGRARAGAPGAWNGAMARWEHRLRRCSDHDLLPSKWLQDLLRPQHR